MKRLVILVLAIPLMGAGDCNVDPVSTSGVTKASVQVQTGPDGMTIEQRNVSNRLRADNKPGSIKHLYVISPYSGDVIVYSTVRGKVTSGNKRLTPKALDISAVTPVIRGPGYEFHSAEMIGDDGTYGESGDYLFWWDAKGVYHQHYLTGGQIVHVSDQPLAVKAVIINMEQSHP